MLKKLIKVINKERKSAVFHIVVHKVQNTFKIIA